ncbi:MAG TPA: polysaccharide biosynthesis C-terminal domain-containing protein [Terriglobales bacterium]|nr:polysaccharide biosynthesis C-terminal domain-containing protein [Terriglobales bacterium]
MGLATGPISARLLGPAGRGELAAIQNLFWLVANLAMLGFPEATLYFGVRQRNRLGTVVGSALVLVLLFMPLFYAAAYFLAPFVVAAQPLPILHASRHYLLFMPIFAVIGIGTSVLRTRSSLFAWNILRLAPALGWFAFLLVSPVFVEPTSEKVAGGYFLVLSLVAAMTAGSVLFTIRGRFGIDTALWRPMLQFGVPAAAVGIPITLNLRLDQMLMSGFFPATTLGLYVVAVSWSGAVTPLLTAIATTVFPGIAAADERDKANMLARVVRTGIILGVCLGIMVAAVTPLALPLLFGKAFAAAIPAALILVVAAVISGLNTILEEGLRGLGDTGSVFWSECGGLIVTALTLLALLAPLGIVGASISSVLGYACTTALLLARIRRRTRDSVHSGFVPQPSDVAELLVALRRLPSFRRKLAAPIATGSHE